MSSELHKSPRSGEMASDASGKSGKSASRRTRGKSARAGKRRDSKKSQRQRKKRALKKVDKSKKGSKKSRRSRAGKKDASKSRSGNRSGSRSRKRKGSKEKKSKKDKSKSKSSRKNKRGKKGKKDCDEPKHPNRSVGSSAREVKKKSPTPTSVCNVAAAPVVIESAPVPFARKPTARLTSAENKFCIGATPLPTPMETSKENATPPEGEEKRSLLAGLDADADKPATACALTNFVKKGRSIRRWEYADAHPLSHPGPPMHAILARRQAQIEAAEAERISATHRQILCDLDRICRELEEMHQRISNRRVK